VQLKFNFKSRSSNDFITFHKSVTCFSLWELTIYHYWMSRTCCDCDSACLCAVAVAVNLHIKLVRGAGRQRSHSVWWGAWCVQPLFCWWIRPFLIHANAVKVSRAENGPRQTDTRLWTVARSQCMRYFRIYKRTAMSCKCLRQMSHLVLCSSCVCQLLLKTFMMMMMMMMEGLYAPDFLRYGYLIWEHFSQKWCAVLRKTSGR